MFCSAPWTTVQIKNDGQFSYCCMSRDPMGNDINDDRLVEGRQKIIDGEVLPVCQEKCLDIEHLFSSQRQDLNRRWPIKNPVAARANPEHIEYIDLRMGNICNYMCLMCGDRDSHLWGKANNKENPYISWAKDPEQYKRIMDFIASCKNLKCISLAGGEPFYNKKQLFDVIDRLDRNIELKFITNMSFCDDEIIAKLNEFKKGRMHCSIDGVGKWIETQRYKSNWENVEHNTLKFARELHDGWEMRLVPTFTVINTYGVVEFMDWIHDVFLPSSKNAVWGFTICKWPDTMSLYHIPIDTRRKFVETLRSRNYTNMLNLSRLCDALEKDITIDDKVLQQTENYFKYVAHAAKFNVDSVVPEIIEELFGKTKLDAWEKHIV